ncbi:heat shock protein Hsp20 [[Leptolyngbya] sp. PCC 7376]|uniref:Hsp20/alpha crystallin family protein n=1 Tax=[Leptolyngbya] sp. PCC 7376 TaxID=111781 RepID=UPI00029EF903|nr:Hsp20/alpha crystallin family protein [[Leptolyngbya] sp. PCC 7376]AFY37575.1 heat shock protein Hsp20 [[Leptolyngbya] sp. PCC 7376]
MSLVRFSPFSELETVHTQMNRILDELAGWQGDGKVAWRPSVELLDGDTELTLKASLPGLEKDGIDISLTRESVRISGEYNYHKEDHDKGVYHSEFSYGKFDRSIVLPVAIDHENASATFADGILTLTLPKVVPTSKKVVKLNLGEGTVSAEAPAIADSENESDVNS